MDPHSDVVKQLQQEIDELRTRLNTAEQALLAVRTDDMSAAARSDQRGDRVAAANDHEDAYRAHILESMSDAVIVTDERFVVAYWNSAAETIYGWRAEEALGRPLREVARTTYIDGDDQDAFRLLQQTGQWRGEVTQYHKDGRPMSIESSVILLRDQGGQTTGLIGVNRDITERRKAEGEHQRLLDDIQKQHEQAEQTAAQMSRERDLLQTVMDNACAMLAYFDRDFTFRMVNTIYVAASGHTQQELIGQNHFALFPDAENEAIFRQVRDTAQAVVFRARPFTYSDQPERGVTYWDWALVPVCDGSGRTEGMVLSLLDVTDSVQRAAEREKLLHDVAEQRTFLDTIVQQLPSGVIIAEAQTGKVIMANEQIARMWGHPFVSVTDITQFTDQYPTQHADGRIYALDERPLVRALRQGEHVIGEVMRFPRPDGTLGSVEARAAPIRNAQGEIIAGAVVLTDITDRLRRTEQLANQALLIENVHEAIMVVDPQLRVTYWNRGAEELYGWTAAEAVGRNASELAQTEVTEAQRMELAQIPMLGNPFRGEYIQHHKDGRRIYVDVTSVGLRDATGNITGYLSANRDMTAQRQAAAALRQSEERFRLALRNSPITVFSQDRELRYTWVYNPYAYSVEDMLGKTDADLLPPETAADVTTIKRRVLVSGVGERSEISMVIGGQSKVFDLVVEPLRDAAGNIEGVTCATTDITERYSADRELRRWGHVFEYAGWGIGIGSADGTTLEMLNPAFAAMHGYTVEELRGKPLPTIYAAEDRPALAAHIRAAHEKGHHTFESVHLRKDGTRFPVLVGLTAVKDERGQVLYRVSNTVDLTERKRQEALLHAQEVRLGALEAIVDERERIGRDLHDGVAQVLGYVRFKLRSVSDLLAAGKVEQATSGVAELEQVARDANADLRQAISGLRISSVLDLGLIPSLEDYVARFEQQWGIKTRLVFDPDLPMRLAPAVEVQLQSMIHEAMSNIRKHAHAHHAIISFTQANGRNTIAIVDDGVGFQPDAAHGQHFGLGIMYERARLINADLAVESEIGKGTSVTISLPVAIDEED